MLVNNPEELNGSALVRDSSLLTTEELARELRVSPVTIKCSRCSGCLLGVMAPPHLKIGRLVRYRRSDVDAWIESLPFSKRGVTNE